MSHDDDRLSTQRSAKLRRRSAAVFVHDFAVGTLAYAAAAALRLGTHSGLELVINTWPWGVGFALTVALLNHILGTSRTVWRYSSLFDAARIVVASVLAVMIWVTALFAMYRLTGIPRTMPVIMLLVTVGGLLAPRMAYRIYRESRHRVREMTGLPTRIHRARVIAIGLDSAAVAFVNAARSDGSRFSVVAIVDPTGRRAGRTIHNAPIFGPKPSYRELLSTLNRKRGPVDYILVFPPEEGFEQGVLNAIIEASAEIKAPIRRVLQLTTFAAGDEHQLQVPDIVQLLGRSEGVIDSPDAKAKIRGKRVLITGAGGSIGGELCRQIASIGPAELAVLDHSEFSLYQITQDLRARFPALNIAQILCDVRQSATVRRHLSEFSPDMVFHAAALKHVPITEAFCDEAFLTNVIGTKNVADAAEHVGVKTFINISTDKAVNAVNVLGFTKRLAELYIQSLDRREREVVATTRFVTVRFGNVIGSSGSVVPLFREQIARGGPVTVTHPDIERFCMSIPEAVSLVIAACDIVDQISTERGQIIVLDMGMPVKIGYLARQMITLAGLKPDIDVQIQHIGLRPGEKMYEELFHENEERLSTSNPRLFAARSRPIDVDAFLRELAYLIKLANDSNGKALRAAMVRLVAEAASIPRPSMRIVS